MSRLRLTKNFQFSASHENKGRVIGHNYTLAITLDCLSEEDEKHIVEKIERDLMEKIRSRDLGLHVDFLKGAEITDSNLLKNFEPIVKKAVTPAKLYQLTLKRDDRTQVSMELD